MWWERDTGMGRPRHATVVAYLALFVALGSGAYAVTRIGTNDIRSNAVTPPKMNIVGHAQVVEQFSTQSNDPADSASEGPKVKVKLPRGGDKLLSVFASAEIRNSIADSNHCRVRLVGPDFDTPLLTGLAAIFIQEVTHASDTGVGEWVVFPPKGRGKQTYSLQYSSDDPAETETCDFRKRRLWIAVLR